MTGPPRDPGASFGPLVETDWLAAELGAPDLRVIECTMFAPPLPDLSGHRVESGRGVWEAGHIPGSGFVDLIEEIADRSSPWLFALPPAAQFATAMGRLGHLRDPDCPMTLPSGEAPA